ncbi:MAG: hypothetical protein ACP59X_09110 [Solidesulfovibrio sp. DCME]|uniref:hypothetical protein n=1 Tax=Solidesulfovibrio sp. DCME TaxID=3447380 RepID=UPI003D1349B7
MRHGASLACLILSLGLAVPGLAVPGLAFDCARLPFGAKLSAIDDGHFVPYRQKDGVAYYNYVGNCRLRIHETACPAIAYAFVDGVFYARLIRATVANVNDLLKDLPEGAGGPVKVKEAGGVSHYVSELPGGLVLKLKYDNASGEATAAVYDKGLRPAGGRPLGADDSPLPDRPEAP